MPSRTDKPAARPLLLVVDDAPPVLKIVERLAAKAGFEVTACGSGAEAMRLLYMLDRADERPTTMRDALDDVPTKPFSPEQLVRTVRSVVAR